MSKVQKNPVSLEIVQLIETKYHLKLQKLGPFYFNNPGDFSSLIEGDIKTRECCFYCKNSDNIFHFCRTHLEFIKSLHGSKCEVDFSSDPEKIKKPVKHFLELSIPSELLYNLYAIHEKDFSKKKFHDFIQFILQHYVDNY